MRLFIHCILLLNVIILLETTLGDPRSKTIKRLCGHQLEHNSTIFVQNFITTMENIIEQMRTSGFGTSKVGSGPDADYGLAQCYGDLSLVDCVLCFAKARNVLSQCYPFNSGRVYLDGCFMRSENYSFYDEYKGSQDMSVCGSTTTKNSRFFKSTKRAVTSVVDAAQNNKGYSRAQVAVPRSVNEAVYVLANCWRSLNQSSCRACLESASASILDCLPRSEGRALHTGCFIMYSDINFLNKEPGNGSSRGTIIVVIVSVVSSMVVLVVVVVIGYHIRKNRRIQKKRRGSNDAEKFVNVLNDSSLNFKYSTLEKATGSFDNLNKLGQGGFGAVYKGVLHDGREIAVKRLFINNRYRAADFYNEVNMISNVVHKNLVRLLGCSCSGPESLLVYEFLPNQSLHGFIFDQTRGKTLNWEMRHDIIIGTAEGLVYLHENSKVKIIHRDIKASNILLDSRLCAKIADFGLARSFQEDKSHISTVIAGTLGYMAPEYLAHGQLTEKADVYSFGVLLLEIVTGRQNNMSKSKEYTDSLVIITWKYFQTGRTEELYDPNIMLQNYKDDVKKDILRVVHIGLLCTQEVPSLRPTMSKALQMLTKKEQNLPAPTNPPFIDETSIELKDTSDDPCNPLNGDATASIANLTHSSFYPR